MDNDLQLSVEVRECKEGAKPRILLELYCRQRSQSPLQRSSLLRKVKIKVEQKQKKSRCGKYICVSAHLFLCTFSIAHKKKTFAEISQKPLFTWLRCFRCLNENELSMSAGKRKKKEEKMN